MARLRPHLPFVPGETPLSWATRLAEIHTGGPVRAFLQDLGIPFLALLGGTLEAIVALCRVTGQNLDPVLHETVEPLEGRMRRLRGRAFHADTFTPHLRFCPLCLLEDGQAGERSGIIRRHRLLWTVAAVRSCSADGVLLVERPLDLKQNEEIDLRNGVPETDAALLDIASSAAPSMPTPLERYVAGRLEGTPGPD